MLSTHKVPFDPSLDFASEPPVQSSLTPFSAVLSNVEWLPDSPFRKTTSLQSRRPTSTRKNRRSGVLTLISKSFVKNIADLTYFTYINCWFTTQGTLRKVSIALKQMLSYSNYFGFAVTSWGSIAIPFSIYFASTIYYFKASLHKMFRMGSGCGSVGRAVTFDIRTFAYYQLY